MSDYHAGWWAGWLYGLLTGWAVLGLLTWLTGCTTEPAPGCPAPAQIDELCCDRHYSAWCWDGSYGE